MWTLGHRVHAVHTRVGSVLPMDVAHGLEWMWNDIVELASFDWISRTALILFLLLPVVSLILVVRGNRPAWIALGITGALTTVLFLHNATDWWGPLGGPEAFGVFVLTVGTGWSIVVWQLVKDRHSART